MWFKKGYYNSTLCRYPLQSHVYHCVTHFYKIAENFNLLQLAWNFQHSNNSTVHCALSKKIWKFSLFFCIVMPWYSCGNAEKPFLDIFSDRMIKTFYSSYSWNMITVGLIKSKDFKIENSRDVYQKNYQSQWLIFWKLPVKTTCSVTFQDLLTFLDNLFAAYVGPLPQSVLRCIFLRVELL